MTAYCEPDATCNVGAPPVFTEVLPAAPGVKPAAMRWTPGRAVGIGLLCIQNPTGWCNCEYLVAEYPTRWDGRAAKFAKVDAGSDPEADGYDVFVANNGRGCRCDCKGFTRYGHCKHTAALTALVANSWLDLHPANPGADAGHAEYDQPDPFA
ncbi:hypothetical protein J0H58_09670 [bacterium]|mgnify:CR=1 FL=1|nr:hypothetical protein [bacterium]